MRMLSTVCVMMVSVLLICSCAPKKEKDTTYKDYYPGYFSNGSFEVKYPFGHVSTFEINGNQGMHKLYVIDQNSSRNGNIQEPYLTIRNNHEYKGLNEWSAKAYNYVLKNEDVSLTDNDIKYLKIDIDNISHYGYQLDNSIMEVDVYQSNDKTINDIFSTFKINNTKCE
ncbi:MAG: hypothetical protein HGA95_01755 [Caldiserica bacterium]|nr:hypothetical protein [Caldisericota bacterium]